MLAKYLRRLRPLLVRRLLWGAGAVLALVAGGALFVDAYGHAQKPNKSDAIVVLGARVLRGGFASNSLRERVRQAVALHELGLAPFIICTGGVGDDPPAEAIVARDLAIRLGVPASQVLVEPHSVSTRENARFAARICREKGWTSVIVVSQLYHLWRARRLFELEGLRTSASAVPNARVDESIWTRAGWSVREALLSVRDFF